MFDGLRDAVFGAEGAWTLKRCRKCHAAYLDPRLTAAAIGGAYRRYYTHHLGVPAPGSETVSEGAKPVRERLRNGYLVWRYGYALAPAWRGAARLLPLLFPRHRVAFDTFVRHLRLPRAGARLLDVGCGAGDFLGTARSLGWNAAGVEVDPMAAATARERGFEVLGASLAEAGLVDSFYDAVTLNHVIEHLHDPVYGLAAVYKALRPGGTVWIATPNLDSPLRHALGAGWRGLEPPRHLVLFTRSALQRVVESTGFVHLRWPATYPLTRWMLDASPIEPRLRATVEGRTLRLKLLELASLVSQRWAEQLVVTARKPGGMRP